MDVRCLPKNIPGQLTVDVTPLSVGDFVSVSELPVPKGVTVVFDEDYNVLTCLGRPLEEVLEEELEGAEGEEGEGGEADSDEESDD